MLTLNVLLVVITAIYVVLTYRILRENRLMRLAGNESRLIARLEPYGLVAARYAVTNVGKGAALNVTMRLKLGTAEATWRHRVMEQDRTEYFFLPQGHIRVDEIRSVVEPLIMTLEYDDVSGEHHATSETIDLKKILDGWTTAGWSFPQTETEKAVDKICDAVAKLRPPKSIQALQDGRG